MEILTIFFTSLCFTLLYFLFITIADTVRIRPLIIEDPSGDSVARLPVIKVNGKVGDGKL